MDLLCEVSMTKYNGFGFKGTKSLSKNKYLSVLKVMYIQELGVSKQARLGVLAWYKDGLGLIHFHSFGFLRGLVLSLQILRLLIGLGSPWALG